VVAVTPASTVLDAMSLMSGEGVSSVAVVEEDGRLLSAISVTDIGKVGRLTPTPAVRYTGLASRSSFHLKVVRSSRWPFTSL